MNLVLLILLLSAAQLDASQLFRYLPRDGEVSGWTRKEAPRSWVSQKLWEYINGGADVYLDYGFKEVAAVELSDGTHSMTVDVYEFETFEGAFGMYARERAPSYRFIKIGAQGYHQGLSLNFYQSKYYVKITAFSDDIATRNAVRKMADAVTRNIGTYRKAPPLLQFLPTLHKQRDTETWEAKTYIGRSELRGAFTAQYSQGGKRWTAFFTDCGSASTASARLRTLRGSLTQTGKYDKAYSRLGVDVLTGNHREAKEVVFLVKDKYLLGVHPARDTKLMNAFLKNFLEKLN